MSFDQVADWDLVNFESFSFTVPLGICYNLDSMMWKDKIGDMRS